MIVYNDSEDYHSDMNNTYKIEVYMNIIQIQSILKF